MKTVVWFHAKISGEGVPSPDAALAIVSGQMQALQQSGLIQSAEEFHIGVNGDEGDALMLAAVAPGAPIFHIHGPQARSEIPTMALLRQSLRPDLRVFYHHSKGITHPTEALYECWRGCMERHCVWNWRSCAHLIDSGLDSVGCHWLTPEAHRGSVTSPFWGGTYWWANSAYLMRLPELPAATWENRYEAESWIGRAAVRAKVFDFHPQWPGMPCCHS